MSEIYFIEGNVPSLKNSKIKTKRGIFPSKTVTKYLRSLGIQGYSVSKKKVKEYKTRPNLFREVFKDWEKPKGLIKIGFHFVRKDKRKFDFVNAIQLPLDLLTAHDLIEDDDCDHVVPYILELGGKYYDISKETPGVWLKIIR